MNEEHIAMIEDCCKRANKLSEWELSFIQNLNEMILMRLLLTDKQSERLESIWERIT